MAKDDQLLDSLSDRCLVAECLSLELLSAWREIGMTLLVLYGIQVPSKWKNYFYFIK